MIPASECNTIMINGTFTKYARIFICARGIRSVYVSTFSKMRDIAIWKSIICKFFYLVQVMPEWILFNPTLLGAANLLTLFEQLGFLL